MFRKTLSIALSLALFWTSADLSAAVPEVVSPFGFMPPRGLGQITDHFDAGLPDRRLVILIQDLHAHYGVQKNIAGLLDYVASKKTFSLAVEGAEGPIDSTALAQIPDEQIRLKVADYLMKEAEMNGAEFYAITHGQSHALTGVENKDYYALNLNLFRQTWKDRQALVGILKGIQTDLEPLKGKLKGQAAVDFEKVERDLSLLIGLCDLQVTEQDVHEFGHRLNQFIALSRALLQANGIRTFDEAQIRDLVSSSIDYYAIAMMRNQPMVDNTLKLMDSDHSTVVLVAGGFHTKPIAEILKARHISYVVMTPLVGKVTSADHDLYIDRLNGNYLSMQDLQEEVERSQESVLSNGWADLWHKHDAATLALMFAPVRVVHGLMLALLLSGSASAQGIPDQAALEQSPVGRQHSIPGGTSAARLSYLLPLKQFVHRFIPILLAIGWTLWSLHSHSSGDAGNGVHMAMALPLIALRPQKESPLKRVSAPISEPLPETLNQFKLRHLHAFFTTHSPQQNHLAQQLINYLTKVGHARRFQDDWIEDAIQETFLRLQKFDKKNDGIYENPETLVSTYFTRAFRNVLLGLNRTAVRTADLFSADEFNKESLPSASRSNEQQTIDKDLIDRMWPALIPKYQQILSRILIYSVKDDVQFYGVEEGLVRAWRLRARRAAKRAILNLHNEIKEGRLVPLLLVVGWTLWSLHSHMSGDASSGMQLAAAGPLLLLGRPSIDQHPNLKYVAPKKVAWKEELTFADQNANGVLQGADWIARLREVLKDPSTNEQILRQIEDSRNSMSPETKEDISRLVQQMHLIPDLASRIIIADHFVITSVDGILLWDASTNVEGLTLQTSDGPLYIFSRRHFNKSPATVYYELYRANAHSKLRIEQQPLVPLWIADAQAQAARDRQFDPQNGKSFASYAAASVAQSATRMWNVIWSDFIDEQIQTVASSPNFVVNVVSTGIQLLTWPRMVAIKASFNWLGFLISRMPGNGWRSVVRGGIIVPMPMAIQAEEVRSEKSSRGLQIASVAASLLLNWIVSLLSISEEWMRNYSNGAMWAVVLPIPTLRKDIPQDLQFKENSALPEKIYELKLSDLTLFFNERSARKDKLTRDMMKILMRNAFAGTFPPALVEVGVQMTFERVQRYNIKLKGSYDKNDAIAVSLFMAFFKKIMLEISRKTKMQKGTTSLDFLTSNSLAIMEDYESSLESRLIAKQKIDYIWPRLSLKNRQIIERMNEGYLATEDVSLLRVNSEVAVRILRFRARRAALKLLSEFDMYGPHGVPSKKSADKKRIVPLLQRMDWGELFNHLKFSQLVKYISALSWNAVKYALMDSRGREAWNENLKNELVQEEQTINALLENKDQEIHVDLLDVPWYRFFWDFGSFGDRVRVHRFLPREMRREVLIHEFLHTLHSGWSESEVIAMTSNYTQARQVHLQSMPHMLSLGIQAEASAPLSAHASDLSSIVSRLLSEAHLAPMKARSISEKLEPYKESFLTAA